LFFLKKKKNSHNLSEARHEVTIISTEVCFITLKSHPRLANYRGLDRFSYIRKLCKEENKKCFSSELFERSCHANYRWKIKMF